MKIAIPGTIVIQAATLIGVIPGRGCQPANPETREAWTQLVKRACCSRFRIAAHRCAASGMTSERQALTRPALAASATFLQATENFSCVIPGRGRQPANPESREASLLHPKLLEIPGSRCARPGMTPDIPVSGSAGSPLAFRRRKLSFAPAFVSQAASNPPLAGGFGFDGIASSVRVPTYAHQGQRHHHQLRD